MSPELKTLPIEQPKTNAIDHEFDTLEKEFKLEERLPLVRALFEDVLNPPLDRQTYAEQSRLVEADGREGIKHFFLPDIPGGEYNQDIKTIREGYDNRAKYIKTPEHIFCKIGQGEMWIIPKKFKPYFRISLSECSAMIADDGENLIIAHISYSAINEIQATAVFMQQHGIDPKNIKVIASIGKFQAQQSAQNYTKRDTDTSTFTDLGIPRKNITAFEFSLAKERTPNGNLKMYNLTHVLGCNEALFKYNFDLVNERGGRERIEGEYREEEIIKL